ncbi:MAG: tRNA dihydrouridine synthase DusB [Alphaproteobacteria bacterium]
MSIQIDRLRLSAPVILAPMSGITDRPFRQMVRRFGVGLAVSEMIASEAMLHAGREARKISDDCRPEAPLSVQLAGYEPELMAAAAKLNEDRGAAIIDINFGCPAKQVVNKACGSALMRDEPRAVAIMQAAVNAVDVPVTVKMRTGWDDANRNAPRFARLAERCGVKMITVHGRTRAQKFAGRADWDFVAEVKAATTLPVVVNGDIATVEEAKSALDRSGADGVMIGRGACGRPWFPQQVAHFLATGEKLPDPPAAVRLATMLDHYEAILGHYGIAHGVRIARKHLGWYSAGARNANAFRAAINTENDPEKVRRAIGAFFSPQQDQEAA